VFRNGVPEDRLSKCTNIDYVSLNPDVHKHVNEIEDSRKLFPHPDLWQYMWSHLASAYRYVGGSDVQHVHRYRSKR
jgi:hypothetical protein